MTAGSSEQQARTFAAALASVIADEIAASGHSLDEVADLAGIDRATLHHRLSGGTPFLIDELEWLSDVFGIPASALIKRAETFDADHRSRVAKPPRSVGALS